jgi:hypothetical protein
MCVGVRKLTNRLGSAVATPKCSARHSRLLADAVHCPVTSYTPLLLHLAEMVPEDAKSALQPPVHVDCTAAVPVLQLSQV